MCAILFVNKLFKNTLLRRRGKTRPSGGGIRMQERHITTPGPVLDEHGVITPGYSERSICTYRRADIKAPFYRIKEWDFYQVSDGEKCLQFTYGHASYAGQVAVMLFNFKTGEVIANISKLLALPFGSLHLPENAEQDSDICYDKGGVHLRFKVEGDTQIGRAHV